MKSNHKRLGDVIREVNARNADLATTTLLGVNIHKFFMPSVANVVGTDMANYKIVKKGQFACNRMHVGRDYRLPVALASKPDGFLVSPAYDVFEINDAEILLPEYLMMWFSRGEFDRNAWFYTDADVRGGLPWKSLCDMSMPVPSIDKQREIIKEYRVIVDRIALNNQLIQKLEETAQAVYRQWFVDFEFPNEQGGSYKTDGGEMEFNDELDKEIPIGWGMETIGDVTELIIDHRGKTPTKLNGEWCESGHAAISAKNIKNGKIVQRDTIRYVNEGLYQKWMKEVLQIGDIALTSEAPLGELYYFAKRTKYLLSQRLFGIRANKKKMRGSYLYFWLQTPVAKNDIESRSTGTTVSGIKQSELLKVLVLAPAPPIVELFDLKIRDIMEGIETLNDERVALDSLKELLLSKLATTEN